MVNERRKFRRFDVALDVALQTSINAEKHLAGVTRNFSRTGLCFESGVMSPTLDSLMDLDVKLPGQDRFVSVSGHVAWKEKLQDKWLVGIEFVEIDKEEKSLILDHAYDLWLEDKRKLRNTV